MMIERTAYAGVSNRMLSMLYAPRYVALDVIPSKIAVAEMPGIENRRAETYPRTEAARVRSLEHWNNWNSGMMDHGIMD